MSLSNYTQLQASVADWLNRQNLATQIPDFIALAEAKFSRVVKTRDSVTRSIATLTTQYLTVPADYAGVKSVILTSTNPPTILQYASVEECTIEIARRPSGAPTLYTIVNNAFEFAPVPDGSYTVEIVYWATIPPLAINSTNWLLTKHPDLYLYGTLMQAAPYLKDDARVPVWQGIVDQVLEDIRLDNERTENSGRPLVMRIRPF